VAAWANTLGRLWLVAAGASLLLPPQSRVGVWLPLHLALAGAATTTISGNMQMFSVTLTASPLSPAALVVAQLASVNVGAAMIAIGFPANRTGLVAAGGTVFALGILSLGGIVLRARRRSLNRRHTLALALYGSAVTSVLVGAVIGTTLGSGVVHEPGLYLALRRAHLTLNLLGFVSLTIAGTLVTLLPTVLRTRMTARGGRVAGWSLAGGTATLAAGFGFRVPVVTTLGGIAYAAGALLIGTMALLTIRTARATAAGPAARSAAAHLLPGLAWFCIGAVSLAWVLLVRADIERFLPVALVMLVVGWTVQVLLGAWSYLVPAHAPGGPIERRTQFAAIDTGSLTVAGLFNAGTAILALWAADAIPTPIGRFGAWAVAIGGASALARTWWFRPSPERRGRVGRLGGSSAPDERRLRTVPERESGRSRYQASRLHRARAAGPDVARGPEHASRGKTRAWVLLPPQLPLDSASTVHPQDDGPQTGGQEPEAAGCSKRSASRSARSAASRCMPEETARAMRRSSRSTVGAMRLGRRCTTESRRPTARSRRRTRASPGSWRSR
jgi:nitrite reductase (NO-forming)